MAVRGTVDANAGGSLVSSVTGTANQVTASPTTGAVVVSTPNPFVAPGPITATGSLTSTTGLIGASATSFAPIILSVKNVTINTAGSPSDIATISVPAGIARYRVLGTTAGTTPAVAMIPHTFTGTMAAATFQLNDAPNNSGQQLTSTGTGPGASSQSTGIIAGNNTFATSPTLYIRQTVDSANAGTLDFYVLLYPMI